MATVFQQLDPAGAQFLSTNFPALVKNGTNFPVVGLAYDAAADESAYWVFRAINYGAGNVTVSIDWYADTAAAGAVKWNVQIAAMTPDVDDADIEAKALAAANTATDTHLGGVGQRPQRVSVTVSNLDGLANNDLVWMRVLRDADDAADTMANDAILTMVTISYSDS